MEAMKTKANDMRLEDLLAKKRAELLARRRTEFPRDRMDFAPWNGFCIHWNIHKDGAPRCGFDLVAHYGEDYPTADITGCPECNSSYCD